MLILLYENLGLYNQIDCFGTYREVQQQRFPNVRFGEEMSLSQVFFLAFVGLLHIPSSFEIYSLFQNLEKSDTVVS